MAGAQLTQGTIFAYNSSGYVTIARLVRVTPPEMKRNKIETSDLSVSQETSVAGITRGGEWTFEINYDPTGTTDTFLWTQFYTTQNVQTTQLINWKLTLTNATPSTFIISGFIAGFQIGAATVDGLQKATVKVQSSGAITIAA